ncbi:MAG: hypothetical protein NC548_57370 [Lachnospiraceae bacterium]|nr:hypothetical protein [Lachnospiraceae bacterium]
MHNLFEWDDSIAGQKYRESQAMYILRSIVVVSEKEDESTQNHTYVRAFVSSGNNDHVYNHISVIVRDGDEYEKLLKQAYADLQNFKRKYSCLKEFEEILALID